jgi:hypothetical protein
MTETPLSKKDILKMSKEELNNYKWSDTLDLKEKSTNDKWTDEHNCSYCFNCSNCSDCFNCSNCSKCSDCSDCSDCSKCSDCFNCSNLANGLYCRNLKLKDKDYNKYYICNVEVTKEEFEKKTKEMGE